MKRDIKDIVEAVSERTKGLCEICYSKGEHYHHSISGKGKRTQLQTEHSVYLLCMNCHNTVHADRLKDLMLKFETQNRYLELGLDEEEIRRLMGDRIYTKEDIEAVYKIRNQPINKNRADKTMRGLR